MVIVNPNQWQNIFVVGFQAMNGFHCLVSKKLVRIHVSLQHKLGQISLDCTSQLPSYLPIMMGKDGPVRHRVEKRPERSITASIVKFVEEALLHENWNNLFAYILLESVMEYK